MYFFGWKYGVIIKGYGPISVQIYLAFKSYSWVIKSLLAKHKRVERSILKWEGTWIIYYNGKCGCIISAHKQRVLWPRHRRYGSGVYWWIFSGTCSQLGLKDGLGEKRRSQFSLCSKAIQTDIFSSNEAEGNGVTEFRYKDILFNCNDILILEGYWNWVCMQLRDEMKLLDIVKRNGYCEFIWWKKCIHENIKYIK